MQTFLDCFIDATTLQNEERAGKRMNFDQSFNDMLISIYRGIYCGIRIKGKVPQIVGLTLT